MSQKCLRMCQICLKSQNCFHAAVAGGNLENMNYLHSLDPNLCKMKDNSGQTALMVANEYGETKTLFRKQIHLFPYQTNYCFY